jgi:hypothetical protein
MNTIYRPNIRLDSFEASRREMPEVPDDGLGAARGLFHALRWRLPLYAGVGVLAWWLW